MPEEICGHHVALILDAGLGRDKTYVILPSGKVDFVGGQLKAVTRPDHVDERAFYMNVLMNSLAREGFELAGMSNDQNIIVMKRPKTNERPRTVPG